MKASEFFKTSPMFDEVTIVRERHIHAFDLPCWDCDTDTVCKSCGECSKCGMLTESEMDNRLRHSQTATSCQLMRIDAQRRRG